MCIKVYIFVFKKQTNKQKKSKSTKRAKETKEEKRIYQGNRPKKIKFAGARVKIFLVTRISGNKNLFFFGPSNSLGADYLFKNGEITALKELILEQKYFVKNSVENLKNQKNGFSNSPLFESLMEKIEQKIKEKLR